MRIGHLQNIYEQAATRMQSALDKLEQKLTGAGHTVTETGDQFNFNAILGHHLNLMSYEAAEVHQAQMEQYPQYYLPNIRKLVETGLKLGPAEYLASCAYQDELKQHSASLFEGYDLLISPATIDEAPAPNTTGDPKFNSPWSFLGLPTLTIPMQLSDNGLPLGLQLIAPPGGEDQLLEDAQLIAKSIR
ncbi:MAG: amidase family protein [Planctomycetaceae bacterium]